MSKIRIKGYREIVPNFAFGRKAGKGLLYNILSNKVDEVFCIERFRYPCLDDIVKYMIKRAENIISDKMGSGFEELVNTQIKMMIPEEYLNMIACGDKDAVDHYKRHLPPSNKEEGNDYLRIFLGIIPDFSFKKTADSNLATAKDTMRNQIYSNLLAGILIKMQNGRIDRYELKYLLDREVIRSKVLEIDIRRGKYEDAKVIIDDISSHITDDVSLISDCQEDILLNNALIGANNLGGCLASGQLHEMIGSIGSSIGVKAPESLEDFFNSVKGIKGDEPEFGMKDAEEDDSDDSEDFLIN